MKKKLLFGSALCLLFTFLTPNMLWAQLKKGNYLVEGNFGNIGLSKSDYKYETGGTTPTTSSGDSKNTSIGIYPRAGIFVADKLVIGTEFSIYLYSNKNNSFNTTGAKTNESKSSSTSLGLLPFVRYYFASSKDGKSMFFGQLTGGVSIDLANKYESVNYNAAGAVSSTYKYNYPKKYSTFSGNAVVGWNRFLSENVALNFNLGYRYSKSTQTNTYTSTTGAGVATTSGETKSTFDNSGINWNMGFTMIIPRGKKK
jgi:hypothetical protein